MGQETPPPGPHRRRAAWPVWVVLAGAAAALTWAVISASLRHGRLASPPGYDDVYYMSQGAEWLHRLREGGPGLVLREYLIHPPHSPAAVLAAATSFALFGVHEWAPYVMNGLVALLYLAFAAWILREAKTWQRIAGVALAATIPMAAMSVHEFRPDVAASILLVTGVLTVLCGRFTAPGHRLFWAGAAFGASLLVKPSVFAATGLIGSAAVGLAAAAEWLTVRPRPPTRAFARSFGLVALGLVLVAWLYPPVGWAFEWKYFYRNIFGGQAAHWSGTESIWYHFRYYLSGHGGEVMFGRHLYLLAGLVVVGALILPARSRDERARSAAIACLLVMTFSMAALNRMKSEFLGLPFQVLFVGAALLSLAAALRAEREGGRRWGSLLLVASLIVGVAMFRWPFHWRGPDNPGLVAKRSVIRGVYDAVRQASGGKRGHVVLSSVGAVNSDLMRLYSLRDNVELTFYGNVYTASIVQFESSIRGASVVVATQEGIGPDYVTERYGTARRFPYARLQNAMIRALDSGKEFERFAAVAAGPKGESYIIYRRLEGVHAAGPEQKGDQ